MKNLLRISQVARMLNCSTGAIYSWITQGKLRAVRLPGGSLRVAQEDLEAGVLTVQPSSEVVSKPTIKFAKISKSRQKKPEEVLKEHGLA